MLNKVYGILLLALILLASYLGFSYLTYEEKHNDLVYAEEVSDSESKEDEKAVEEVEPVEETFKEITITGAGDIMTHLPIIKAHFQEGLGYDFSNPFKYVRALNEGADLRLANLETVVRDDAPVQGFPTFNAPYPIIYGARYGGFNVLSTANNHSYDQGKQGVLDTISHIKNAGLDNVGTNASAEEDRTRLYDFDGIKIGLMSYSYGLNGFTAEEDYLVNIINLDSMAADVNHLKAQGADKIILFVHWGVEYRTDLYEDLQNLGHDILDLGVDYILGSHPHVVMPVETFDNGKFIVYSMGNFLSNQRKEILHNQHTEQGLFVRFKLEKDLKTNIVSLKELELIPTWVNKYFTDRWYYEIIPINEALNGQVQGLEVDENLQMKLLDAKSKIDSILYK
ncbi:MAG: CapA family protein [Bacillota bacterium]|nr:CapA family protein [Bacillota bacterium]